MFFGNEIGVLFLLVFENKWFIWKPGFNIMRILINQRITNLLLQYRL